MDRLAFGRALRSQEKTAVKRALRRLESMTLLDEHAVERAVKNNIRSLDGPTLQAVLQNVDSCRAYQLCSHLLSEGERPLLYRAYQSGYCPEVLHLDLLGSLLKPEDARIAFPTMVRDWIEKAEALSKWEECSSSLVRLATAFPDQADLLRKLSVLANQQTDDILPVLCEAAGKSGNEALFECIDELGWPDLEELALEKFASTDDFDREVRTGGLLYQHTPYTDHILTEKLLEAGKVKLVYGGVRYGHIDRAVVKECDKDGEGWEGFTLGATSPESDPLLVAGLFQNLSGSCSNRGTFGEIEEHHTPSMIRAFYSEEEPGAKQLIQAAEKAHTIPANFGALVESRDHWPVEVLGEAAVRLIERSLRDDSKKKRQRTVEPLLQLIDAGLKQNFQTELLVALPLRTMPDHEAVFSIQSWFVNPRFNDPAGGCLYARTLFQAGVDPNQTGRRFFYHHLIEAMRANTGASDLARLFVRKGYLPEPEHVKRCPELLEAVKDLLDGRQKHFLAAH